MADFSIEHGHGAYTDAELLEQARANAQALILATIAFLEANGVPPHEWAAAIGGSFSRGWGDVRPWDAGEFLDAMLTNMRALGANVIEVTLDVDRAEASTCGFPDPDLCALLGVDQSRAGAIHDAAAAIAAPRGLHWTWRLEADGVTRFVVERQDQG